MTNYGTGLKKNHVTLRWHNYCMMPGHTPHPLTHTPRTSLSLCLSPKPPPHLSLTCVHMCDVCVYLRVFLCVCVLCVFVNCVWPTTTLKPSNYCDNMQQTSLLDERQDQTVCLPTAARSAAQNRLRQMKDRHDLKAFYDGLNQVSSNLSILTVQSIIIICKVRQR